jgi:hypothetical protein
VISANHESSIDEKAFYFVLDVVRRHVGIGGVGAVPTNS